MPSSLFLAGTCDGRIVRTKSDANGNLSPIETIVYTGNPKRVDRGQKCGSVAMQAICGRPLSMDFNPDGKLIVIDTFFGLMEIDVEAKTKTVLVDEVGGMPLYFPNSVAVGKSGKVYFTESSTRWRFHQFLMDNLEMLPCGRLMEYDPATKKARVLADEISFTNGILVDPTESFLVFVELNRAQILRYDLTQGTKETVHWDTQRYGDHAPITVFIDNLACIPDNLSWSAYIPGTFWTGCPTLRRQPFSFLDWMAERPWVRSFLVGTSADFWARFAENVSVAMRFRVPNSLTERGTIVETLQDPTVGFPFITGVYENKDGYMYIGTVIDHVTSVPRVKWNKANATATATGRK